MLHLRSLASIKSAPILTSLQVLHTPTCHQSTLPALKKEQINSNMQLKTIQTPSDSPRPLVLLFGWMLAKQRHLDKYAELYHGKGFDVLSLLMRPTQVLVPTTAQKTMDVLIDVIEDPSLAHRPLLHHGFSVGGYMYGELLVKLNADPDRYEGIRNRLVGQIFDSPVDLSGIPVGFSSVLTKNKILRSVLRRSLEGYLSVMQKPITSHYIRSSKNFRRNEMELPSLFLFSKSDPIGLPHVIEQIMENWKEQGIPVAGRCWDKSPHVSHFHRYPDEYLEALFGFLHNDTDLGLGMLNEQEEPLKKAQAL